MRITRSVVSIVPLAFATLVAGCGGGDRPKLVTVTGKVVHKDQPLTAGSVTFHPEPGHTYNGDRPSSVLQVDGTFTMQTYPHGDGAPPGKYKVTLSNELVNRIRLPKYGDVAKTPLEIEVPDSGVKDHTFVVK